MIGTARLGCGQAANDNCATVHQRDRLAIVLLTQATQQKQRFTARRS